MSHYEFEDLPLVNLVRLHLLYGKHNAITQSDLAKRCLAPLRTVQEATEAMKRAGLPIVTGPAGVWMTNDASELRDAYRRDRRRALTQLANNRGRLKAIRDLEGVQQQTFWTEAA